jgi:hypothetical protein
MKEINLIHKILDFSRQITFKSFLWPHLARGPYVVHAFYSNRFLYWKRHFFYRDLSSFSAAASDGGFY